jgi:hypothetical protein
MSRKEGRKEGRNKVAINEGNDFKKGSGLLNSVSH